MPARWSRYDTSPLPDPEGGQGGEGSENKADAAKSLLVRWDRFHVPATVTPDWTSFANATGNDGSGGKGGDGKADDSGGGGASGTGGDLPPAPERSVLHVQVDDMLELEQRILDHAKVFASQFNDLRNRSLSVATESMWGLNETDKVVSGPDNHWSDVKSPSAESTEQFLKSFGPSQQIALQHAANIVVLSGTLIELLDKSAEVYATQDQRSVFPDKDSIIRAETDPG